MPETRPGRFDCDDSEHRCCSSRLNSALKSGLGTASRVRYVSTKAISPQLELILEERDRRCGTCHEMVAVKLLDGDSAREEAGQSAAGQADLVGSHASTPIKGVVGGIGEGRLRPEEVQCVRRSP